MPIPGNLLTTAMAVMPHTDVDRALEKALEMDIPFWPQLPNLNYYEDMYVQAAEHFPGILLDVEKRTLRFSMDKFIKEFEEAMAHLEQPSYFDISPEYSVVYHKFMDLDLSDRPAIRGQLEGPISFGFPTGFSLPIAPAPSRSCAGCRWISRIESRPSFRGLPQS